MKLASNRLFHSIENVILLPVYIPASRRKNSSLVLMLAGIGFLTGCFDYYKTSTITNVNADSIQNMVNRKKYFLLQAKHQHFVLSDLKINNDHLEARTDSFPAEHIKFLRPNNIKAHRFPATDKEFVLNSVSLYTTDSIQNNAQINIPVKDVQKIDVYKFDKGRTTRAHSSMIVGISLGVVGLIFAIILISSIDKIY